MLIVSLIPANDIVNLEYSLTSLYTVSANPAKMST